MNLEILKVNTHVQLNYLFSNIYWLFLQTSVKKEMKKMF